MKFKTQYFFIIVALVMLLAGGFVLFNNIGSATQSINPSIPSSEKLLTDSSINYDRVEQLKFKLVTSCDIKPKCDNELVEVKAGEYVLASFNPSDCDKVSESVSKDFIVDISGSVLRGVSELEAIGGCSNVLINDASVIERQQCNVDSDCSFTKSSNVLRSSNGQCKMNRCYYSIANVPSDIPTNNIITGKPVFSLRIIIGLLVIGLVVVVYQKFFRKVKR